MRFTLPLLLCLPASLLAEPATGPIVQGPKTQTDIRPFYFSIPAPRGQILDRKGRPLAQSVAMRRLVLSVPVAERSSLESYHAWISTQLDALRTQMPFAVEVRPEQVKRHYDHRRELPISVSALLTDEQIRDVQIKNPHVSLRTEYVRYYPNHDLAAHALGYVEADGPAPAGPTVPNEALWQRTRGATGLEAACNAQLTGTDGLIGLMIADEGKVMHEQVFTEPVAGHDVVTTLNLETQQLAEKSLNESKHRGALVIVDANTGDLRALASNPRFDPNAFAQGISAADYQALTSDRDGPLFDRSAQGSYPPGSVFKPVVVMAGVAAQTVDPLRTFECGPSLNIDGREFDNWSKDDRGSFDARAAIIRSCNTYFYQSAMLTRDSAILHVARELGYGTAPSLPIKTAAGSLPARAPSNADLANLAIGQGVTEASPVQVAYAMAAIANGACRPRPRLVMQTQSQARKTDHVQTPARDALMPVDEAAVDMVRHAMFGVVNHERGTGRNARLDKVAVFGKTGTAQWVLHGQKANVVWFAGFVDTTPPLAFAVTIEGDAGEGGLSGGGVAAPVIAKVLHDIEANPATHGVSYTPGEVLTETDSLFYEPEFFVPLATGTPRATTPPTGVRGFFSRLFR